MSSGITEYATSAQQHNKLISKTQLPYYSINGQVPIFNDVYVIFSIMDKYLFVMMFRESNSFCYNEQVPRFSIMKKYLFSMLIYCLTILLFYGLSCVLIQSNRHVTIGFE